MAKLTRITGKVFGSNATATVGGIGQFGSAITGTPNLTTDVATIQALPAYLNGWGSAVITSRNFPPIEEVTGVLKTISYQACYTLQEGIPEYDINTEYSNTSLVKSVNNGIVTIYASLQNNNIGNSLSNGAYWKPYILDRIQRNIGEIVQSAIPLTDAGLHLLDGSLLSGSGSYGAFVTYIAGLYTDDPTANYFTTEADWQTSVSTYGVCGKFVYDSVNNTVRLPRYSNKIYTKDFVSTAPVIGNGMALGLTDGTSNIGLSGATSTAGALSYLGGNASSYGTDVGSAITYSAGTSTYKSVGVVNDPAKSGLIADLANITTSLEGYYYIVVATSTKTNIEVDIDEIATDLNGKADVDLTNTTPAQTFIDTSIGWGMPDYTAGISVSAGSFTPTTNGYWIGNVTDRSDSTLSLKVGTTTIFDSFYTQYDGSHPWCFPLAKGVTYTIGGSGWVRSNFYPCIGEV